MDKNYISSKVKELSPWYQTIDFDGVRTSDKGKSSITVWNKIKTFLPESLEDMRVLDLGSNSGLYSVCAAILGAEVVSIELVKDYYKQSLFVKEFFEDKHKKQLKITNIISDISKIDFDNIGKFDYIFAIAILYHIGSAFKNFQDTLNEQVRVVGKLTKISNSIIVRSRIGKYNNEKHYIKVFSAFDFKDYKSIPEDGRTLTLFQKNKG